MLQRHYIIFSLFVSVAALTTALIAQLGYRLEPCILCVWQRVPYFIIVLLAPAFLLRHTNAVQRNFIFVLCFICFAIGACLAFYHVGVEQHWWKSAVGCDVAIPHTIEELRAQLYAKKVTPCDQAGWQFTGLSMAAWNAIASFAFMSLGVFCRAKDQTHGRKKQQY